MPVVAIDHRREDVGERLVERTRLEAIGEIDRALDDAVGHLVRRHVERPGQRRENVRPVAKGDKGAIPEGIVHRPALVADVDQRGDRPAPAVEPEPPVGVEKVFEDPTYVRVRRHRDGIGPGVVGRHYVEKPAAAVEAAAAQIESH